MREQQAMNLRFQFQYGTIKRVHNNSDIDPYKAFQFQYGTIKRTPKVRFHPPL